MVSGVGEQELGFPRSSDKLILSDWLKHINSSIGCIIEVQNTSSDSNDLSSLRCESAADGESDLRSSNKDE